MLESLLAFTVLFGARAETATTKTHKIILIIVLRQSTRFVRHVFATKALLSGKWFWSP